MPQRKNLKRELRIIQQKRMNLLKQHEEIMAQIHALKNKEDDLTRTLKEDQMIITDHAVVRYLERVGGLDVQVVKDAILPQEDTYLREQIGSLREGEFPVNNSHRVVVRNGAVITVISLNGDQA